MEVPQPDRTLPFSICECIKQIRELQSELRRHHVRYSLEPEIVECEKKTDRVSVLPLLPRRRCQSIAARSVIAKTA
jgi:hypothetical protein